MKKILLPFAIAGMLMPLSAQNETEVLQNYKYRVQQYRQFSGMLRTDYASYNNETRDTFGNYNFGSNTRRTYADLSFGRYYYSNTEKRIFTSRWNGNGGFSLESGRNGSFRDTRIGGGLAYSFSSTNYKPGSVKFWRLSGDIGGYSEKLSFRGSETVVPIKSYTNSSNVYASANISKGKGRIENISDPSFMAFWLRDMKEKGIIGNYSDADLEKLALALTKTRNTRIMDFRFRAIDQIKMLDSAFQMSGLLKDKGVSYYTTLYDHYLYANNYQRFHGRNTELGISVSPMGSYNHYFFRNDDTSDHFSRTTGSYSGSAALFYRNEMNYAASLHSQWSIYSDFRIGQGMSTFKEQYYDTNYLDIDDSYVTPFFAVSTGASYMHIFSTRNYLRASYQIGATRYFDDEVRTYQGNIYLNVNYYYWFSPNFQFTAGAGLNLTRNGQYFKETGKTSYNLFYNPSAGVSLNYVFY